MVFIAGVWYCIDFVLSILILDDLIYYHAFCAYYPYFGLFAALDKGKITKETYKDREA